MKKRLFRYLAQWGIALLLFICLFVLGDVSQLTCQTEIDWGFVFLAFFSGLGFTFAHNFRWKGIVDRISGEKRKNFFSLYRYLLNSYAFGMVVPLDVSLAGVRSYYLKQSQQLSTSLAIFSVLLDRFLDVFTFIFLALPSFLFITRVSTPSISILTVILFLLVLSLIIRWKKGGTFSFLLKGYYIGLVRFLSRVPLLRKWITTKGEFIEIGCHFDESSVFQIMGWNFIKYIFLSLRFYFTGQALGVPFSLVKSFFFIPFIQLSGFVNITPGGLGVVEAGTYGALFLMGIPKSQILIFVFGQRVLLITMFMILFVLYNLFLFLISSWKKGEDIQWRG